MGSAPSPPPTPNPSSIVNASQNANMTNQSGPLGSLNYTINPGGQASATTNSAFQPGINSNVNAFNSQTPIDTQNVVKQGLQYGQNYLQPYFDQQSEQLASQLQNQGLDPNSKAADFATNSLRNQQTNALGAMLPQLQAGAQSAYMLPEQAAQGAAGATTGNFVNTPQTNVNAAYDTSQQAQEYNYGQGMQNYSAMMGGLFGIPSALLGGWARGGFGMPGSRGA